MKLDGIDISHHQYDHNINLSNVPFDFVICKTTQGVNFVDYSHRKLLDKAIRLSKLIGMYHYAGGNDPVTEAKHFLEVSKDYIGKGIMALDWEEQQNKSYRKNSYQWVKTWCDYVTEQTGIKPVIYTGDEMYHTMRNMCYEFWIARYPNRKKTGYQRKPIYEGYYDCVLLQYTGNGRLTGYADDIDLDKFYGDSDKWEEIATGKIGGNMDEWKKDNNGWWFQNQDGSYPKNEWKQIKKKWYYFDSRGYAVHDTWTFVGGNYFYLQSDCSMATGWLNLNEQWYFLNHNGIMLTGWILDNANWYYMNQIGQMQFGWIYSNKNWYYLDEKGVMSTGLKVVKEEIFFFADDGHMCMTNERGALI